MKRRERETMEKSVRKRRRQQRSNAAVDESYANNDNWESLMLLHTTQRWKPQLAHAKVALTADFTITGEAFTDSRLYSRFPLQTPSANIYIEDRSFVEPSWRVCLTLLRYSHGAASGGTKTRSHAARCREESKFSIL